MTDPQIQQISFSFQGGLATKQDEFQVQPPNLLSAQNVRFSTLGQVNKRPGFTALSRSTTDGNEIVNASAGAVFNNELLIFDGKSVYSYLQSVAQWVNRGSAFSIINEEYSIVRNSNQQNNPDATSLNGVECYVWEDSEGGLRYSVLDSSTGAFFVSDVSFYGGGSSPKVIAAGNKFVINFKLASSYLGQFFVNTSSPSVISQMNVLFVDGLSTGFSYDAISYNGSCIIVYNDNNNHLCVVYNNITYRQPITHSNSLDINCIATTIDSFGNLWIAYNVFDSINNVIYTSTFNIKSKLFGLNSVQSVTEPDTLTAVSNITIVENPQSLGSVLLCDELNTNGVFSQYVNVYQLNSNGINPIISNGNRVALGQVRGVGLASKAFSYNGNGFVNLIWDSYLQATYFTVCLTSGLVNAPIGKYNFQVGGQLRTNGLLAQCDTYNAATGIFLTSAQRAGSFETNTSTQFTVLGVNANILNFNHSNSFNSVQNSNNLFIAGAVPQMYDGTSVVEVNFNLFPEGSVASVVTAAGTNDGYYQYIITYEWTDQSGQVHRSQQSQPVLINSASIQVQPGQGVRLTIPTLRLTAKQNPRDNVQIVIYRTIATETVFYKIASINNSLLVDTITYLDIIADAVAQANPPGYWQSQVPNAAPPPCSIICNYSSRTILSGLDDPNIVWYSQDRYDVSNYNSVPIEFSALFTIGCDPYGDVGRSGITAIQKMDNNLYLFKENAIFYVNSDGPQPSGTGDQFPLPSLLTSDIGCNNPNSIAFSPMGLLFDSGKGIYLLGRDQSVSYIGAPVEAFNSLTITSAQLLDDTYEVIFTTQQGTMLVWNYYFNQPAGLWSTWQGLPAVDSVIWYNNFVIFQQNGQVLIQDNTNTKFSDDNGGGGTKPIQLSITLPWISSSMQSWNMIYSVILLGNFKGQHTLQCYAEYNYAPGYVESAMISSSLCYNTWGNIPTWGLAGTLWGGWNPTPYQFQLNFSRPMCQAIRLTFQDLQTSNYNEGYTLNNIVFNVQILGGTGRVPENNRIGTIVTKGQ